MSTPVERAQIKEYVDRYPLYLVREPSVGKRVAQGTLQVVKPGIGAFLGGYLWGLLSSSPALVSACACSVKFIAVAALDLVVADIGNRRGWSHASILLIQHVNRLVGNVALLVAGIALGILGPVGITIMAVVTFISLCQVMNVSRYVSRRISDSFIRSELEKQAKKDLGIKDRPRPPIPPAPLAPTPPPVVDVVRVEETPPGALEDSEIINGVPGGIRVPGALI